MGWMKARMPGCEQSMDTLWLGYVRKPSLRSRLGMFTHLVMCRQCRRYRERLGFVESTLNQQSEVARFSPAYKLSPQGRDRLEKSVSRNFDMNQEIGEGDSSDGEKR
jgi:hypothetical protein